MTGPSGSGEIGSETLISAVSELARADTNGEVARVLRRAAHRLVGAAGTAVALVEGDYCHFVEEEGLGPGWRGRRIPVDACLCGLAVSTGQPVVVPDVRSDVRLQVAPYWSGPVAALAVVPVRTRQPIGALAVHWPRTHRLSAAELRALQALADSAALAVELIRVRTDMDRRVRARTSELEEANRSLQREISERSRAEAEVRQMSLVDELTGLYNRRGFHLLAGRELAATRRNGRRSLVLYIDIDGLKRANDTMGHEAGDRLLSRAATVLRSVTRETDVAARMGGDEFAVFMTLGYDHPPIHLIVERYLQAAGRAGVSWSIGATASPPDRTVSLDDLLAGADEAMYRGRRARRRSAMPSPS